MPYGYHNECKECEHLWHCFGPDAASRIRDGNAGDLEELPWRCKDFYPEVRP